MEPVIAPLVSKICLALCNLIGVVWENVINTPTMNIHIFAKVLHTYA